MEPDGRDGKAPEELFVSSRDDRLVLRVRINDDTFMWRGPRVCAEGETSVAKESNAPKSNVVYLTDRSIKHGTNILDVVVPPQLETKVKTGLAWFDRAADKDDPGLTPSTVLLLTAKPGCGKSTLARQLGDTATGLGHTVLYNAGEESIFQVRRTANRLDIKEGFFIGCDVLVDEVLVHARALLDRRPGKQLFLILDSLATLDDGKYSNGHINSMTAVRVMERVVKFCKETYAIAIVIGHVNKKGEFAGKGQLKHQIDAHAHMKFLNASSRRVFNFSKNRFGQISTEGQMLDMQKKGLVAIDEAIEVELEEEGDGDAG